jgi:hypothetical protein
MHCNIIVANTPTDSIGCLHYFRMTGWQVSLHQAVRSHTRISPRARLPHTQ